MRKDNDIDKELIVTILSNAFNANRSVNYIIKQDAKRFERIRNLMSYSYELCAIFGKVYLSDDKTACALVMYPDKKKASLKTSLMDIGLIFSSIGLANVVKAIKREAKIAKQHPANVSLSYLWFIGVDSYLQNKGTGTNLLKCIIADAIKDKRMLCLETSTERNIPWYKKNGFEIYNELDFGYRLYCLKKEL